MNLKANLLLATAALLATLSCGGEATVLYVTVKGKCGVPKVSSLGITFTHEGQAMGSKLQGTVTLPSTFVLRVDGRTGPATLAISGFDSQGKVAAMGKGSASLVADQRVDLTVVLSPTDLQVNTRHQYDQVFSTRATGRQLAVAKNGNFVVVWKDLPPKAGVYNIWYRLFDSKGNALLNFAGTTNEARANVSQTQQYDHPAIAMQYSGNQAGSFVIAMTHWPSSGPSQIRVRSFTAKGNPGTETAISTTNVSAVPHIAVLQGSAGYVVVWQEYDSNAGKWKIMGHLLDAQGKPSAAPAGSVAPFQIAELTYNQLSRPLPVVTGGGNGGFMVVWRENSKGQSNGNLKAATYGNKSGGYQRLKTFAVAHTQTFEVREFNVGTHINGFAVIWTDKPGYKPDNEGTAIRFRRFDYSGAAKEREYTVNTSAKGNQDQPALAAREDGSLLAVWSSDNSTAADPVRGIYARRILSNGLPAGNEILVNTTTPREQFYPSVVGQAAQGFVVTFADRSGVGPDTQGTGIRARVLCPDYQITAGTIGSLCDADHPCNASLICKQNQTGRRCVAQCTGAGAACHHGGVCTEDKKISAWACMYP